MACCRMSARRCCDARRSGRAAWRSVGPLARTGVFPVHDRGRVLVDLAVMIADGGEALCDIDVLRHQGEVFGPAASDTTVGGLWTRSVLRDCGASLWRGRRSAPGCGSCSAVYRLPGLSGWDIGAGVVVLDVDSTILIAHSDKENAATTYKHTTASTRSW